MVTRDNLKRAEENGIYFLSRLPATFNECARAIEQAVAADADQWTDVGALAQSPATGKRPAARYRVLVLFTGSACKIRRLIEASFALFPVLSG